MILSYIINIDNIYNYSIISNLLLLVLAIGGQIGNFFDIFSANWRQLAWRANWAMPIVFHREHGFPDWQK